MVEVSESLREQATAHKRQLIFEAQSKNNSAAVLAAYKEAALDAFRNRAEKTIERYIDALVVWGIELNDDVEREMLMQVNLLLSGPKHVDLPPGLKRGSSVAAMQSSYARELARLVNAIRRKAANRLRETGMKEKRPTGSGKESGTVGMVRNHETTAAHHLQGKQMAGHSAIVFNVLIASPSDVSEEREVVTKAINDWNATHYSTTGILLHPVKWESHSYPAFGERPQASLNKQIVESGDILIGIFGCKLGTPTGTAQSGTIEEIEEFRKARKYVALYFSTADVPRDADRNQLEALEAFKKQRRHDTLYFDFENCRALQDHLTRHLSKIVHDVRKNLDLPDPELVSGSFSPGNAAGRAAGETAIQNSTLLADVISELEDNLDRALRPRAGDVYRRPSNRAWLENRNKGMLPAEIQSQVKNAYDGISSWADIVGTGLNPNLGSMQLNLVVSSLASSLPHLIKQLRSLPSLSADAVDLRQEQGTIKSSDWERMAEKLSQSCRFLRADSQWNSATRREVWRIAGGNGGMCEALLQQAGAMLLKSPKVRVGLSAELLSETGNLSRWLLYLKQRGFHEVSSPGYAELEDGTKITHLLGGIRDLPGNSQISSLH